MDAVPPLKATEGRKENVQTVENVAGHGALMRVILFIFSVL